MFNIVLYTGGTCGDLVSGVLDMNGVGINGNNCVVLEERSKLKKSHLFLTDNDRDNYIDYSSKLWSSIPSHDSRYHMTKNHEVIGIVCTTYNTARWAADRFKNIHRPAVWEEVCKSCNIDNVEQYAELILSFSNLIEPFIKYKIFLEDICKGNLLSELKKFTDIDRNSKILYDQWLKRNLVK